MTHQENRNDYEERLIEPKDIKQRLKIGMSFGKGVHMVQIS